MSQISSAPAGEQQIELGVASASGITTGRYSGVALALIVLAISTIGWWRLIGPDFPVSYDGDLHVARLLHMEYELQQGQFPVRWGSEQAWGYGYPTFEFFNPLPYYIGAVLHMLGLSATGALKLIFVASIALGGIFMALWVRSVWGWTSGLVAGVLYALSPATLAATYVIMTVGEVMVVGLLPVAGWAVVRANGSKRWRWSYLSVAILAAAGIVLSHNIIGGIGLGIIAAYGLAISFAERDWQPFLMTVSALLVGLAVAAFFWLPAYAELGYTRAVPEGIEFDARSELLNLSLKWGPEQGADTITVARPRVSIGAAQLAALVFAGVGLAVFPRLDRTRRTYLGFTLAVFAALVLLLVTPFREQIWSHLPLLDHAQYSGRLLVLAALPAALAAGAISLWAWSRSFLAGALVVVAMVYGVAFARPALTQAGDDAYFREYTPVMSGTADWARSVLPRWAPIDRAAPEEEPKPQILNGTITAYEKRSTHITASVEASAPALLDVPVYYFPGWAAWVDGVETQVGPGQAKGTVQVPVTQGTHQVEVRFTDTTVRRAGNLISLAAIAGLVVFTAVGFYRAARYP